MTNKSQKPTKPVAPQAQSDAAKAAAMLAAEKANAQAIVEHADIRTMVLADIREQGVAAGRGARSIPNAAFAFATGVSLGALLPTDARMAYLEYVHGHNSVEGDVDAMPDENATGDEAKSLTAQVSVFATFALAGPIGQGLELYSRVALLRATVVADEIYGSLYQTYAHVNRGVHKLSEKVIDAAKWRPTDDELLAMCRKAPTAEKSDDAKLDAIVKALVKLGKTGRFAGIEAPTEAVIEFAKKFALGVNGVVAPMRLVANDLDDGSNHATDAELGLADAA